MDIDWVVGKARGEIPWFGLLKLWFTDSLKSEAPDNSVTNLWIAIAIIIIVPITIDVVLTYRIRKRIARRRETARREYDMGLAGRDASEVGEVTDDASWPPDQQEDEERFT